MSVGINTSLPFPRRKRSQCICRWNRLLDVGIHHDVDTFLDQVFREKIRSIYPFPVALFFLLVRTCRTLRSTRITCAYVRACTRLWDKTAIDDVISSIIPDPIHISILDNYVLISENFIIKDSCTYVGHPLTWRKDSKPILVIVLSIVAIRVQSLQMSSKYPVLPVITIRGREGLNYIARV